MSSETSPAGPDVAPTWHDAGERDHFVQFYEHETVLMDSLSGFVRAALESGAAAIVIATRAHLKELEGRCDAGGMDLAAARARGQYIPCDAANTLSRFMVRGWPQRREFTQLIEPVLVEAERRFGRVVAFGEMVALLWNESLYGAAIHLEALWNELAARRAFTLFCAYPTASCDPRMHAIPFHGVCSQHSFVVHPHGSGTVPNAHDGPPDVTQLQQKTAVLEREVRARRAAEGTLARREQDLSEFLESAIFGIHRVGPDGTIQWANRTELELLGYSADEYIGRNVAEFHLDPADAESIMSSLRTGESLRDRPATLRCKDGSVRHVLISSNTLVENGKFIHTRCFTRDVTDRVRVEQALQQRDGFLREMREESELVRAHLAAIVESSDDAIISKDLNGQITSWNSGATRLYGYTAMEAVGRHITLLIPPELHPEELDILDKLRAGARVDHYETVRVGKDGRRLNVSLTVSPVRDANGKIIGASKIARDITGRKRAEAALRQSEDRLQRLADNAPVLLVHCSPDNRFLFVNTHYAARFGLQPHEIVGRTIPDVLGQEAYTQVKPYVQRVLAGEHVEFDIEVMYRDIGKQFMRCAYEPDRDSAGNVVGYFGALLNITERKRQEEALRESARRLTEVDRRKDAFLATLAHELRNPLAPIRNALHFLRLKGSSNPDLNNAQGIIDRQVRHMVRLVDDLLDVSRVKLGHIRLQHEQVSLGIIVTNAVEVSRPLIDAARHELSVELPQDPLYVEGDSTRLSQVIQNLLNNAAKYTPAGGRIVLRAERIGQEAAIRVSDTGIGIPREMLGRVFEMFTQVDRSNALGQGGLGIGLALAQQLVEMHGGRIDVHSDGEGRGSEFTVRLPLCNPPATSTPVPALADTRRHTVPRRVLVVDDNVDSAETMAMNLGILGHETRVAFDGEEAISMAREFLPDVILLDIGMPKLDGYGTCRLIRQQPWGQRVKMIALTGWGQEEDRRRTQDAGFDHHLVKPVDMSLVTRLLEECAAGTEAAAGQRSPVGV